MQILDRLFKTRIDVFDTAEGTRFAIRAPYLIGVILLASFGYSILISGTKQLDHFEKIGGWEFLFLAIILSAFVWETLRSIFPTVLILQNDTLRLEHKVGGIRIRQEIFLVSEIQHMQVKEMIGARGMSHFDVMLIYRGKSVQLKLHLSKFAAGKLLFELYQRTLAKASSRQ